MRTLVVTATIAWALCTCKANDWTGKNSDAFTAHCNGQGTLEVRVGQNSGTERQVVRRTFLVDPRAKRVDLVTENGTIQPLCAPGGQCTTLFQGSLMHSTYLASWKVYGDQASKMADFIYDRKLNTAIVTYALDSPKGSSITELRLACVTDALPNAPIATS